MFCFFCLFSNPFEVHTNDRIINIQQHYNNNNNNNKDVLFYKISNKLKEKKIKKEMKIKFAIKTLLTND